MAIAFVKHLSVSIFPFGGVSGVILQSGETVQSGQFLIAHIAADNGAGSGAAPTISVADPRGNVWTVQGPVNRTVASVNNDGTACYIAHAYINNTLEPGDSINFSFSTNVNNRQIGIDVFSGVNAANPVAVAFTSTTGATVLPANVGGTPTAGGQLCYATIAIEGPLTDGYTEDSDTVQGSWTTFTAVGTNSGTATNDQTSRGAYKIASGTASQAWSPTLGTARDRASMFIIFAAQPALSGAGRMLEAF